MRDVVNYINRSKKIIILSHKNPDGDALGSSLGLALALQKLDKQVCCWTSSVVDKVFNFLPGFHLIQQEVSYTHYDLVILLDCANFKRVGVDDIHTLVPSFDSLLVIDHHPPYDVEKSINAVCWVDDKRSSTAVMIYELLQKLSCDISKDIAICLLTGIFTDTGGFQHSNTDTESLEAAAFLVSKGARVNKIADYLFSNKSVAAIKLWGKALSRITTDKETGMAVSYIYNQDIKDVGASKEDLDGVVSIINTIGDADFSLLLTETENSKIKGSLRSEEYKGVDVSQIARGLGGGGHKLASGFELEGDIKNSLHKVNELVLSLQTKSHQE